MNCRSCRDKLSLLIDGQLTPEEARRVQAHLDSCADCRRELDGLREIVGDLGRLDPMAAPRDLLPALEQTFRDELARPPSATEARPVQPLVARLGPWRIAAGLAAVSFAAYAIVADGFKEEGAPDAARAHEVAEESSPGRPEMVAPPRRTGAFEKKNVAPELAEADRESVRSASGARAPSALRESRSKEMRRSAPALESEKKSRSQDDEKRAESETRRFVPAAPAKDAAPGLEKERGDAQWHLLDEMDGFASAVGGGTDRDRSEISEGLARVFGYTDRDLGGDARKQLLGQITTRTRNALSQSGAVGNAPAQAFLLLGDGASRRLTEAAKAFSVSTSPHAITRLGAERGKKEAADAGTFVEVAIEPERATELLAWLSQRGVRPELIATLGGPPSGGTKDKAAPVPSSSSPPPAGTGTPAARSPKSGRRGGRGDAPATGGTPPRDRKSAGATPATTAGRSGGKKTMTLIFIVPN